MRADPITLALSLARPRWWLALVALAACTKEEARQAKALPVVVAVVPSAHLFIDRIEAVGTARANEQVTLASPVTDRIERLYFDDGGYVRRGQVVATLAAAQERARLAAAFASERQASAQLARVRQLSDKGFATGALLDQQTASAGAAASLAQEARAEIADRVIRSPFAGFVSLRTISAGAIVAAGTPIATVSDISRIKLDFTVPETALAAIRPGQPIVAVSSAYPDLRVAGRVAAIDPVLDPASRAATIRAILPNPGLVLKPGMLLTVAIEAASHRGLALPELAVVGEGDDRYVFVLGRGNKVVRTAVRTGSRDGGLVEVKGLPAGGRVVTEGVVKVSDGMTVRATGR